MNVERAREIVAKLVPRGAEQPLEFWEAKGYIQCHEKARGLEEVARLTADQIGPWIDNRGTGKFEPGMITCLDKLRIALAQWQKES